MLKKMSRILHPVAGFQEKRAVKAVQQMPSLHQTLGTEVLLYSQRIVYCFIVQSRNCSRVLVVSVAVMPFGTAKKHQSCKSLFWKFERWKWKLRLHDPHENDVMRLVLGANMHRLYPLLLRRCFLNSCSCFDRFQYYLEVSQNGGVRKSSKNRPF